MKRIALLLVLGLLTALVVGGCSDGPSSPVYIVVTATAKPYIAPVAPKPQTKVGGAPAGSPAARHIATLRNAGWTIDDIAECRNGDCAALYQECSYILIHFSPATGVESTIAYGIDFSDHDCDDGGYMADIQDAALRTLDADDANMWMQKLVYDDKAPDEGERIEDVCGDAYCALEMDTDSFLMLTVFYGGY